MRIFLAGATGAIGKPLVPALLAAGHQVVAMTRSPDRAKHLTDLGAQGVVCDVYDLDRLRQMVRDAGPEIVINELTDLPQVMDRSRYAEFMANNDRIRTLGGDNLLDAAISAAARRYIVESVAFLYEQEGDSLKDEDAPMIESATSRADQNILAQTDLEGTVLRYGYFYGPDTYARTIEHSSHQVPKNGCYCFIHIDDAAAATVLALAAPPGAYNVVDDTWLTGRRPAASNQKFKLAAGWEPRHAPLSAQWLRD